LITKVVPKLHGPSFYNAFLMKDRDVKPTMMLRFMVLVWKD